MYYQVVSLSRGIKSLLLVYFNNIFLYYLGISSLHVLSCFSLPKAVLITPGSTPQWAGDNIFFFGKTLPLCVILINPTLFFLILQTATLLLCYYLWTPNILCSFLVIRARPISNAKPYRRVQPPPSPSRAQRCNPKLTWTVER